MSTLRVGRRRSAILPTLVVVAVLVVLFAVFTSVWTDRLWYRSFDYGSVFTTMLATRIGLFVVFGLIMAAAVAGNAAIAYRLRPRLGAGATPSSPLLERYRELLESRFTWVTLGVAALVGLFAGGTASGQIFNYLAWRNATPFDVTDPQFGLDVSFFVFGYPWWRFVLSFVFAALVISAIVAAIVHYTMGGLRFSGARRGASRGAAGPPVDPDRPGRHRPRHRLLVRPVRAGDQPHQPAVHRHLLHRRQRDRDRQDDPGDHRRHLRPAVLRQRGAAALGRAGDRRGPAAAVGHRARAGLPRRGAVLQRPAQRAGPGAALHRAQHRRHPGGVRGGQRRDHQLLGRDHRDRRASSGRRRGAAGHPADRPERGRARRTSSCSRSAASTPSPRPWTSTATPSTARRPTPWSRSARWTCGVWRARTGTT